MKKKLISALALAFVLSLLCSACGSAGQSSEQATPQSPESTASEPAQSQTNTPPQEGSDPTQTGPVNTADDGAPQYGGDIVFASNRFNDLLDVFTSGYSVNFYYLEPLFMPDWGVDRSEYGFTTNFIPTEYYKGCLALDYEQVDLQTILVYLRQDVYWQDKEPVNGRQFVANDVVYHYSRLAGLGDFAADGPSPQCGSRLSNLESVTALDDFTVEFKFKEPSASNLTTLLDQDSFNYIMAPEVVEAGVANDWEYAVGTGPWILTDLVPGNSASFERNPNYWGYDERYPENRLPYADTLTVLSVADSATKLAGLRSGEIDFADELTLQQFQTLQSNENSLLSYTVPFIATNGLQVNMTVKPFDDIRVRKAMQMSIDRETMAAQYFGGVSALPAGWVNPNNTEYAYNYEEWPANLQAEYSYDPETARTLLAEAGYPDGFSFTVLVASNEDLTVLEILKSYFSAVGIEMTIDSRDAATAQALATTKEYEAYWTKNTASGAVPSNMVRMDYSTADTNYVQANDPDYDALCEQLIAATSDGEIKQLCTELDQYVITNHWGIRLFPTYIYNVHNEGIHGYSGENLLRMGSPGGWFWARIWTTN